MSNTPKHTKTINISLPEDLLKKIDIEAKSQYASRSDYIRETIVRRLKNQRVVDDWGDDGEWETVVDFNEIGYNGVPVDEVLAAIRKLVQ